MRVAIRSKTMRCRCTFCCFSATCILQLKAIPRAASFARVSSTLPKSTSSKTDRSSRNICKLLLCKISRGIVSDRLLQKLNATSQMRHVTSLAKCFSSAKVLKDLRPSSARSRPDIQQVLHISTSIRLDEPMRCQSRSRLTVSADRVQSPHVTSSGAYFVECNESS